MGQEQHGVERMVQGRKPIAGVAGHQPAAIDQEHDPLALVGLKGPARQLAPPRRRTPVEMARIVSLDVVAQPFKLVVRAQPARPPQPHGREPIAPRQHREPRDLVNVGINPNLGPERPGVLPSPEPQAAGDERVDLLEHISPAPFGHEAVGEAGLPPARHRDVKRGRLRREFVGNVVAQPQRPRAAGPGFRRENDVLGAR